MFLHVCTFAVSLQISNLSLSLLSHPLLMHTQYLGYLDLYLLSIHSTQRRKKIYSLNQSGEPEVWNAIHTTTLLLINSMMTRLSTKKQPNESVAGMGAMATSGPSAGVVPSMSSGLLDHNIQRESQCLNIHASRSWFLSFHFVFCTSNFFYSFACLI